MATDYLPRRDSELGLWAVNFDTLITAGPGVYGLVAGDATFVHGYVDAFTTTLQTASNPATRTPGSVAAKDGAKAAMIDIVRLYARQIQANAGVSNQARLDLGLTVADQTRTPVPAPVTAPVLAVVNVRGMQHTLRYTDEATPDSRAKPPGALGLQLFSWLGAVNAMPPSEPGSWPFNVFVTHQPITVDYEQADAGKIAHFAARWQTSTGLTGPWSQTVRMQVVGVM